jgi:hypothetical protein
VITADCVRRTGRTRDGVHREAEANPPNNTRTPTNAVANRSRSRRPYRSGGLLVQMLSGTVESPTFA